MSSFFISSDSIMNKSVDANQAEGQAHAGDLKRNNCFQA